MRLCADDADRLLDLVASLHEPTTPRELAGACRAGLMRLIPADICDLVVLEEELPEDERYLGTPGGYTAEERSVVLAAGYEHPVVAHFVACGDTGPRKVSDLLPLDRWKDTAFYSLSNRRLGQDYEIAAILPGVSAAGMAGIAVSRAARDFDDRERTILGYFRGPLGLALRCLLDRQRRTAAVIISADAIAARFPRLTRREAEVLSWIVEGKRDAEMAAILGIRPATATTHVRNLLSKLGVESRLAAAMQVLTVERRTLQARA